MGSEIKNTAAKIITNKSNYSSLFNTSPRITVVVVNTT